MRRVLVFMAVGSAYGVLLRAWMRFVSTDPEFSWSGTGYIVGVFTFLGLMAGVCSLGRTSGWLRKLVAVRILGGLLALGCFMAAGIAMFPTIVPAALGVARSDWWRWLRGTLIAAGVVAAVFVVLGMNDLTLGRRLTAAVLYLGLCAVEVTLFSRILAPSLEPGTIRNAPHATRAALVGLPLLAVFALVIVTVGISVD